MHFCLLVYHDLPSTSKQLFLVFYPVVYNRPPLFLFLQHFPKPGFGDISLIVFHVKNDQEAALAGEVNIAEQSRERIFICISGLAGLLLNKRIDVSAKQVILAVNLSPIFLEKSDD